MTFALHALLWAFLLSFIWFLGYLLLTISKSKSSDLLTLVTSIVLGLTLPSIVIMTLNYLVLLPVTRITIVITYSIIFGLVAVISKTHTLKSLKKTGIEFVRLFFKTYKKYPTLLLILILGIMTMGYLRFGAQTFSGADSTTYLYRSSEIVSTGHTNIHYDRNVVHFVPALFMLISGVSSTTAIHVYVLLLFLLLGLSVAALAEEILGSKYVCIIAMFATINPVSIRLSLDMFAMLAALISLVIAVTYFFRYVKNSSISELFILIILWASLFNLHGLIAYGSLGIIGLPVVLLLIQKYITKNVTLKKISAIGIFAIVAAIALTQPFTSKYGNTFYELFIEHYFVKPLIQQTSQAQESNETSTISKKQQTRADTFVLKETPSLTEFPDFRKNYFQYYGHPTPIIVFFSTFVLLYIARWDNKKRTLYSYWLLFTLLMFSLSQQRFVGMNWLPSRFVLMMMPFIFIQLFILFKEFSHVHKKHYEKILVVGSIILFLSMGFDIKNTLIPFHSGVKQGIFHFMKALPEYISSDDLLVVVSNKPRLPLGLNPQLHVYTHVPAQLCRGIKKTYHNPDPILEGLENIPVSTKVVYSDPPFTIPENKHLYILVDSTVTCLNYEYLNDTNFELISEFDTQKLLLRRS